MLLLELNFAISSQVFSFVQVLSFGVCLVNSECSAYLGVDQNLVYSYPKMILIFFCLILGLISVLK